MSYSQRFCRKNRNMSSGKKSYIIAAIHRDVRKSILVPKINSELSSKTHSVTVIDVGFLSDKNQEIAGSILTAGD